MKIFDSESKLFSEVSEKISIKTDLNAPLDEKGNTYLHNASSKNFTRVIALLIESGALVDKPILDGDTALGMAANLGHVEAVELLISLGADVNYQSPDGSVTPLMDSCINGHIDVVKSLIKHEANLNISDGLSQNALTIAIHKRYFDIAKILINAGIDINSFDLSNNSPVTYAIIAGDFELVESLLKRGAHTNIKGLNGYTLLHNTLQSDNSEIIEISRKYFYSQINEKNLFGDTPVNTAVKTKNRAAIDMFVQDISKGTIPGLGRNDLCPCGSEFKYKKCCFGLEPNEIIEKNKISRPPLKHGSIMELLEYQLSETGVNIQKVLDDKILLKPTQYIENTLNHEVQVNEVEDRVDFITTVTLCEPHKYIETADALASILDSLSKFTMTSFSHRNGILEYRNSVSFDELNSYDVLLTQLIMRNRYCIYKTLNSFNKLITLDSAYILGLELFINEFVTNRKIKKEIISQLNSIVGTA